MVTIIRKIRVMVPKITPENCLASKWPDAPCICGEHGEGDMFMMEEEYVKMRKEARRRLMQQLVVLGCIAAVVGITFFVVMR